MGLNGLIKELAGLCSSWKLQRTLVPLPVPASHSLVHSLVPSEPAMAGQVSPTGHHSEAAFCFPLSLIRMLVITSILTGPTG